MTACKEAINLARQAAQQGILISASSIVDRLNEFVVFDANCSDPARRSLLESAAYAGRCAGQIEPVDSEIRAFECARQVSERLRGSRAIDAMNADFARIFRESSDGKWKDTTTIPMDYFRDLPDFKAE